MERFEVTSQEPGFKRVSLPVVLRALEQLAGEYTWSLQLVDAVGRIDSIFGFPMAELEKCCEHGEKGLVMSFADLIRLADSCTDVVDILVVGCTDSEQIPKAYKTPDWEVRCDVILSREDSSTWSFSSTNPLVLKALKAVVQKSDKK